MNLSPPETIGDAYLAATGCIPHSGASPQQSASRLARMALDMHSLCESYTAPDGSTLRMRIGIHAGPIVAGIVGLSMIRYQCVIEGRAFLYLSLDRAFLSEGSSLIC